MGKVASVMKKNFYRFNAENRASRFLEKEKLPPAPTFESNLKDIQRTLEVDPNYVSKQNQKDNDLNERLKQVYVTSSQSFAKFNEQQKVNDNLPKDIHTPDDFEYGFKEPPFVPLGKCTLKQALQFINDNQFNSKDWNAKRISEEYKLCPERVEKILEYFKAFAVHTPDAKTNEKLLESKKNKLNP